MKKLRHIIKNNFYLLEYVFKNIRGYAIIHIIVQGMFGMFDIYMRIFMSKQVIDAVQFQKPFTTVVLVVGGYMVSGLILHTSAAAIYEILQPRAQQKLTYAINKDLIKTAANADISCYDNTDFYNDYVFVTSQADQQALKLLDTIANCFKVIIMLTGLITFVALYDIWGFLFFAVSTAGKIFINFRKDKLTVNMDVETNPHSRRMNYINRVFYLPDYAKEIRLNPISSKMENNYSEANHSFLSVVKKYARKFIPLEISSDYLLDGFLINTVYMLFLAIRAITGVLTLGTFTAMISGVSMLRNNVTGMLDNINAFHKYSLYVDKIKTFLQYENTIKSGEISLEIKPKMLELKNVSFNYPGSGITVLKDISMKINPGEKIAIVGYNGAGKSTLIKLLMRLYDPSEGSIYYAENDVRNYVLDNYRAQFGTVFQDFQLFAATLAENIKMDLINPNDIDKINEALKLSGFGNEMPQETCITREFENDGFVPSGGQAQKIAIARGFYQKCAVAILDEPSAALDPISEYNLNAAMLEAAKEKTVIFISHRLSTTKMADKIYMFEKGRLIEQGSHNQLMEKNGKYAKMFKLQSEKYQ